jgi:hypothetical protein
LLTSSRVPSNVDVDPARSTMERERNAWMTPALIGRGGDREGGADP